MEAATGYEGVTMRVHDTNASAIHATPLYYRETTRKFCNLKGILKRIIASRLDAIVAESLVNL